MPGTKEIRMKIRSVQNTRKITKAMEMVAASKMRKAQERMRHARPYGEKIRNVAAHISHANPEYRHPFLVERDSVHTLSVRNRPDDLSRLGIHHVDMIRAGEEKPLTRCVEGEIVPAADAAQLPALHYGPVRSGWRRGRCGPAAQTEQHALPYQPEDAHRARILHEDS